MAKQTKSSKGTPSKAGSAASKGASKAVVPAPKPRKAATPALSDAEDSSMLEKFALDSVKDIYYAEKQILKALPRLSKAATSQEVKDAFTQHVEVTKEQISRLEQVFELMGKRAQGKKCEAIEGIIKESESIIEDTEKGTKTRDVALIVACQKVEHYEIATYGGLVQIAKTLGMNEVADLLAATLAEEKQADEMLTQIAETSINIQALGEESDELDEED